MPKYTNQIVVFLDILGFSNMLTGFEQEALANNVIDEDDYHESLALNRLLNIFQETLKLISERNCNYYVFSDNICITLDYVIEGSERGRLFLEIILMMNILNYEFLKEGYFIRGGIDAGWFLDSRAMAAGLPLVEAYRLESKIAVYPRIMLSNSFIKILDEMRRAGEFGEDEKLVLDHIIIKEEGLQFINGFLYIQNFEDTFSKREFLSVYREKIIAALARFGDDERIGNKYRWTVDRFNVFLEKYVKYQHYYELGDTWNADELLAIKEFKIN